MWHSSTVLVLFNSEVEVSWEVIVTGICIQGHSTVGKEWPVDLIGSFCGGVIVFCVKWYKWLLFSRHTLEGPAFLLCTITHNSLGSSQVDRLTHAASGAHLSTGPAA